MVANAQAPASRDGGLLTAFHNNLLALNKRWGETENAIKGLYKRLEAHEKTELDQAREVNQCITETRDEMTAFRTETRLAIKKQDDNFQKLNKQLMPIIQTHQTLASLPRIIKWTAVILGGISTIIGALIVIFIYLDILARAALHGT